MHRKEPGPARARSALAVVWLGVSIFFSGPSAAESVAEPSEAEIHVIESSVVMPRGARPVSAFARYYASAQRGSHRIIRGVYVLDDGDRIVVTTAEKLPVIFDGRCSVVTVEYDVQTAAFLQVSCNGVG